MAGSLPVAGEPPSRKEMRLIIGAWSLGTISNWNDFIIYGMFSPIIGRVFFSTGNPTVVFLYESAFGGIWNRSVYGIAQLQASWQMTLINGGEDHSRESSCGGGAAQPKGNAAHYRSVVTWHSLRMV